MNSFKIGTRITSGFFAMLLMLAIIAGVNYFNVNKLNGEIRVLTEDKWVKSELVNDLINKMDEVSISAHTMMLANNAATMKTEEGALAVALKNIDQDLEKLGKLVRSEKGKKLLGALMDGHSVYLKELTAFLNTNRAGRQKEASTLLLGTVTQSKKICHTAVDELALFQDGEVVRVGLECNAIAVTTNVVTLVMAVIALLIGMLSSLYLTKSISTPLHMCVEAAVKISEGNTAVTLDTTARDETGVLCQSMAQMVAAIRLMISDARMLADAAVAGALATRADERHHRGEFRSIVRGFNETLDAVVTPINEVRTIMEAMAKGELGQRMTGDVQGEFAVIKESLNNSLATFSAAIGTITQNARQVAAASAQTSGAVSLISDGSHKQFQAIVQVATAVKQTAASIADISRNTEKASLWAKDSVTIVSEGQVKMALMVDVVNSIARNSEKINKFSSGIEKIATKTNMLSLNAAIEAARAGEHGRGFAVVAEEVGKLSVTVAELTQEIAALVNQAVKEASYAVATVNEISGGMRKISAGTSLTESMLQRISVALEEQSAAVQDINVNITSLNRVAESNAAASEEITATVVELARLADNTRREAEQFSV